MVVTKTLKQGEGKNFKFTVTDSDGAVVDITTSTLTFTVKRKKSDSTALIEKLDAVFDKTDAVNGIAKVNLDEDDTNLSPRQYIAELKVYFSASSVEKSQDIIIIIEQAVQ